MDSFCPRRIFLDSCAVQMLFAHGEFIFDGGSVNDSRPLTDDRVEEIRALRDICLVHGRFGFEWIVSQNSIDEAADRKHSRHLQWAYEIAQHAAICLEGREFSAEDELAARKLDDTCFGYLSTKDRLLLKDAILLRCDAFLTTEKRLPKNAPHLLSAAGVVVLTPVEYWRLLRPCAALWV